MRTTVIMPVLLINDELKKLTEAAIASLQATDNSDELDILTIDNTRKNLGYPAAVNKGMTVAQGEYIAIANNDIRVSPNWLDVAKEILQNPAVGSAHFRMIDYDEPIKLGSNTALAGRERWCTASFFVIRRKAFVWYDERYGLGGGDDWDFFHRMRHINGWLTAYTTRACYQHKHSSTQIATDDGLSRKVRDIANMELFKTKYGKYPEDIWKELYPEQMAEDYYGFFKKL